MSNRRVDEKAKVKKGKVTTGETVQAKVQGKKGTMIATGIVAAFFGIWAISSLISGMIAGGGPLAFVKAWFTAAFGG